MSKMKLPDGWKYIKLSELFDEVSEKNHSNVEVLTIVQGVGTVPRKDSGRDIIYDKNSLSNYKYVQKDDFIIHLRSFEGGLESANQEGIVSPAYIILHPKIQTEPGYLYTLFHSNRFINQTMAPAVEGVRDGRTVKYEVLKNQSIPFPPLAEQQKIAEILCRQDKIISLKQKLLEQKLQQKKWLMHKLLEVPHSNANSEEKVSLGGVVIDKSGWKKEKLGNCVDFLDNLRKPVKEKNRKKGCFPYYGASGIIDYVDDYIFDGEFILLGEDGANILFRSTPLAFKVSGKLWINNHAHVMQPKSNFDIDFLSNYLESLNYEKYNTGSAQPKLNQEICETIEVLSPSLPEQKIIAQVLSAADKEIALIKSSIEQEKQKKKSLAQLLLTGTVRVNT